MWCRVSTVLILLLVCLTGPRPAGAQDVSVVLATSVKPQFSRTAAAPTSTAHDDARGPLLMTLYFSTVSLQMLDAHSTHFLIDKGGRETNPMLAWLTPNKPAFYAAKAGFAAATILAAHSLAKRNKPAAIITLVAVNGVYAAVVAHNYRAANSQR